MNNLSQVKEVIPILIDSSNRSSGTASNFTVTLSTPITRVKNFYIRSVEIPFSYYVVNSVNNTLTINDTGLVNRSVTITAGNYTSTTLITEVLARLGTIGSMSNWTMTFNTQTYKYTLGASTDFIVLASSTFAPIIGFLTNSARATSATSDSAINLSGPNYLYVNSTNLSKMRANNTYVATSTSTCIHRVVVDVGPSDIIIDRPAAKNRISLNSKDTIDTIDLQLNDPQNNAVNLNGLNWSIEILLEIR